MPVIVSGWPGCQSKDSSPASDVPTAASSSASPNDKASVSSSSVPVTPPASGAIRPVPSSVTRPISTLSRTKSCTVPLSCHVSDSARSYCAVSCASARRICGPPSGRSTSSSPSAGVMSASRSKRSGQPSAPIRALPSRSSAAASTDSVSSVIAPSGSRAPDATSAIRSPKKSRYSGARSGARSPPISTAKPCAPPSVSCSASVPVRRGSPPVCRLSAASKSASVPSPSRVNDSESPSGRPIRWATSPPCGSLSSRFSASWRVAFSKLPAICRLAGVSRRSTARSTSPSPPSRLAEP